MLEHHCEGYVGLCRGKISVTKSGKGVVASKIRKVAVQVCYKLMFIRLLLDH